MSHSERKNVNQFAPQMERLEDRLVPTGTPTLDLTTPGVSGSINGAIFEQTNTQPTGTGVIHSFLRLQNVASQSNVEQGYNTDARPLQFDENKSPNFTRSLHLSELPQIDVGGVLYREMLLDINQKSSQPFLSLDELRIYVAGVGNLTGYASQQLAGLSAGYDLGTGNWIKLDARINHGSGSGDMLAFIPESAFAGSGVADPYVYTYSKFGVNLAGNGGFEEWAPATVAPTGSISGTVFYDTNSNGIYEPNLGETGLANQVVFLDANHNGVLDSDEVYTYTNGSGFYSFNNLATGMGDLSQYQVTVVPPVGLSATTPTAQDIWLATSGQSVTNVNFGFVNNGLPNS
jgi:hypothetical protein